MRVVVAALVLLNFAPAAVAQPDVQAREAFAKGSRLYEAGDYVGAIEAFGQANTLKRHFRTLCNLARCHEELAQPVQAAEFYRQCLREGGSEMAAASEIRANLTAVEGQIVWLNLGSSMPTDPPGEARLNGRWVGPLPLRLPVDPGTHQLEVRWPQRDPVTLTVTARAGERRDVMLTPSALVPASQRAEPVTETQPPERGLSPWWFWGGVALTAGFAAALTTFGVLTLVYRDDYETNPTQQNYDRAAAARTLTNVFVGLTAASGVATTTLFFFTDFEGPSTVAKPVAFGVGLTGRF